MKTEDKPKAPKVQKHLFGHCSDAQLVESGVLVSSSGPDVFHGLCPGRIRGAGGRVTECTCTCHADLDPEAYASPSQPCPGCGSDVYPHDCEEVRARRETNPLYRMLAKVKEEAEARKAEIKEAERLDREANPKPGKSGRCHHCGEPTKGGMFVAGHDMKLKGELFRLAREQGDVDAAAEIVHRGWSTKGIAPAVLSAAEERATKTWFDEHLARRMEGFDQ